MNPISLFLELEIEALNRGRETSKRVVEFLTNLLNKEPENKDYHIFVNPVSYHPEPKTRIAKVYEDCYQLFMVQKEKFPRIIKILIFFKGEIYDNFLIRIDDERQLCEIEDIQMGEICNRGIGSICLKNLETVLLKTGNVKRIIAGLAPRDYERREHLYHFYHSKNGFQIVKEVTRYSWGLVEKKL